ncbi:MAG: hypothetical protein A4E28_00016 [Methanocella sp. PtaU1.Bin125]|nr:MAG: hypothetical protein A4E28_00016 [Methanocella sp. PtaU1.Bin125]
MVFVYEGISVGKAGFRGIDVPLEIQDKRYDVHCWKCTGRYPSVAAGVTHKEMLEKVREHVKLHPEAADRIFVFPIEGERNRGGQSC